MPIYEYRCKKCKATTTVLRNYTVSDNNITCKRCGKLGLDRMISSFACHTSWGDEVKWAPDSDAIEDTHDNPAQLAHYIRRMKDEMGEVSPQLDQMVDELGHAASHTQKDDYSDNASDYL